MPTLKPEELARKRSSIEEIVKQRYDANVKAFRGIDSKRFLGGSISTVRLTTNDDKDQTIYVLQQLESGDQIVTTIDELISIVSSNRVPSGLEFRRPFFNALFSVNAVTGIIALLLTITIVYLVVIAKTNEVPSILANALTTILGFYFGRTAVGQQQAAAPPPS